MRYILTSFLFLGLIFSLYIYKDYFTPSQERGLSNMIWYQIIPDRWANGSIHNDATTRPLDRNGIPDLLYNGTTTLRDIWLLSGSSPWSKDWFVLTDLEKKISESYSKNNSITPSLATSSVLRNRRFGGDFEGIENNIPYLEDLGIDIVLLHPIWLSDSSMRYDVKDWRHIDPRLTDEFDNRTHSYTDYVGSGYADTWDFTQSDKDFFEFIDEFHDQGMRVVLDMSLLYISSTNYLIKDVALYGKDSPYYEWFDFSEKKYKNDYQSCDLSFFYNPEDYPGVENISYQGWWGDCSKIYIRRGVGKNSIPDGLYEYYLKIIERRLGTHTINKTSYRGADGIRIDASGEFPYEFLHALYQDIKKINPDAIVMAEERSTETRAIEYKETDTMSFYPIRMWLEALVMQQGRGLTEGVSSLTNRIESFYQKTSSIDRNVLVNYLSSHDSDRVVSRLIYSNRNLATRYFQQDGTDVLWEQGHFAWDAPRISRTDHDAHYIHTPPDISDIHLLKGLIAFQFLMPGSPIIYYGDEKGMFGADDPDNRQPMRWNITDHFPRHSCKRNNNPLEYCRTDNTMENYTDHSEISQWYKKMIDIKKTSPAAMNGRFSMNICYKSNETSSCSYKNILKNHPLRGFQRQTDTDHIIYLGLGDRQFTSLSIQTDIPHSSWKNLLTDEVIDSDENGFLDIATTLLNDSYMILRKI